MSAAVTDKPLLVSGPRARVLLGIGNTKFWELVKLGQLQLVDVGRGRMVTYASVEALARPQQNQAA